MSFINTHNRDTVLRFVNQADAGESLAFWRLGALRRPAQVWCDGGRGDQGLHVELESLIAQGLCALSVVGLGGDRLLVVTATAPRMEPLAQSQAQTPTQPVRPLHPSCDLGRDLGRAAPIDACLLELAA